MRWFFSHRSDPTILMPFLCSRGSPWRSIAFIFYGSRNATHILPSRQLQPAYFSHHAVESFSTELSIWRPLCLYYTQGQCRKTVSHAFGSNQEHLILVTHGTWCVVLLQMDDPVHVDKFDHDMATGLHAIQTPDIKPQSIDYMLVLDLEGKIEVLEFPVVLIDAKTTQCVGSFHRFVRPVHMSEARMDAYIEGKYGSIGIDRVWHDTAIPFKDVLNQFEDWLQCHKLWRKQPGSTLLRAAFVTCGNWDLKTALPRQCKVSGIPIPSYFLEWINLKDIYLNFYRRKALGMRAMMNHMGIRLMGHHHLGIDDARNIAKVLQNMLGDGASMVITARRSLKCPEYVEFLLNNRVR